MGLLDQMWDDVLAGPQPERGLGRLRKLSASPAAAMKVAEGESSGAGKYQRSMSMPQTPATPAANSSSPRENVWRSVFNPGSNSATKTAGADLFDKPQPNSPTVYDWLYSAETKSNHR